MIFFLPRELDSPGCGCRPLVRCLFISARCVDRGTVAALTACGIRERATAISTTAHAAQLKVSAESDGAGGGVPTQLRQLCVSVKYPERSARPRLENKGQHELRRSQPRRVVGGDEKLEEMFVFVQQKQRNKRGGNLSNTD